MSRTDDESMQKGPVPLEGHEALREGLIQIIGLARQSLLIQSQKLEGRLYRNLALVEALKQQALSQRRLRIQILVSDTKSAIREAEIFIELGRRLSSQFEFREPQVAEHSFENECVIADRSAYAIRNRPDSRIATFALHDPIGAHTARKSFEQRWLEAMPSAELRKLPH